MRHEEQEVVVGLEVVQCPLQVGLQVAVHQGGRDRSHRLVHVAMERKVWKAPCDGQRQHACELHDQSHTPHGKIILSSNFHDSARNPGGRSSRKVFNINCVSDFEGPERF